MWDTNLFLSLNFDGGTLLDSAMTIFSGKLTWAPLYVALLYAVWRKGGWRSLVVFLLCAVVAVGLSDMVAGIFKHTGPLKHLWQSFPVRLRPMHTPELEGLVHSLSAGGQYGTVSAHAATTASVAIIAGCKLRKKLTSALLIVWVLLVSYSRIYLGYHFPQDILLGWFTGALCSAIVLGAERFISSRSKF